MRTLPVLLLAFVLRLTAGAAEPWLKANDVVALVGGEDIVALAEEGWLETLVTWAQPQDHIRFRSLAWEGDTVFEQRRDLNYPTLETQLDKMGATVVVCQFGKMESFAGKEGVAAFTEAYEKLIARINGEKEWRMVLEGSYAPHLEKFEFDFIPGGRSVTYGLALLQYEKDRVSLARKRRIVLVLPMKFATRPKGAPNLPDLTPRNVVLASYRQSIRILAAKLGAAVLDADYFGPASDVPDYPTRDGIHLGGFDDGMLAHFALGLTLSENLGDKPVFGDGKAIDELVPSSFTNLCWVVHAKNRLWFHYTRPQNWAFLAGNRTNQPSSRDHRDPTKRWFPEEMEQWLPLIEAKEKEIWALAAAPR